MVYIFILPKANPYGIDFTTSNCQYYGRRYVIEV